MSIGPMGMIGSAAGSQLAQTSGSDVDRAQQDRSATERKVSTEQKSGDAAGIGQTEEDEQTSERDADGRRIWEAGPEGEKEEETSEGTHEARQSKDPTGMSGTQLDLSG